MAGYIFTFIFSAPFSIVGSILLYKVASGKSVTPSKDLAGGIALLIIGLSVLAVAAWVRKNTIRENQLKAQFKNQPWKWKDDWAKGYTLPNEKMSGWAFLLIGLLFMTLPVMALPAIQKALAAGQYKALFALAFPLAGLMMLVSAIRVFRANKKFGDAKFHFGETGVLGGHLKGQIQIPFAFKGGAKAHLTLSNCQTRLTGHGKNRRSHTAVLWQETSTQPLHSSGRHTLISIDWSVPFDTKPTDESDSDNRYHWIMEVKVEAEGIDFKGTYDVPVFQTSDSNLQATQSAARAASPEMEGPRDSAFFALRETTAGTEIRFLKNQKGPFVLALFVIGSIFGGVGLFMLNEFFTATGFTKFFLAIFPVAFGGAGLLINFLALYLLVAKCRIVLSANELVLYTHFLGYEHRKAVPWASIRSVSVVGNTRQGNKIWYDLKVDIGRKLPLSIACTIPDKTEAEWVAYQIEKRLNRQAA